jgi:DNA-binding GntR family transcriptional regulator
VKSDSIFKRAYNDALAHLQPLGRNAPVPTETSLASALGVSRTTVRKILLALKASGSIAGRAGKFHVASIGPRNRRFAEKETLSTSSQVEKRFMEWMLQDNAPPGTIINELDLARKFDVATTAIREFLNRFQHYGLIQKRPNGRWLFKGFTNEFAMELFEVREMFELRSADLFARLPPDSHKWVELRSLLDEHSELLKSLNKRYLHFSDLDRRFHMLVNSAMANRFVDGFYGVIALVFHYHYQWNKIDERQRNEAAIHEHIAYIEALLSRSPGRVRQACRAHLHSARETLLRSTAALSGAAGGTHQA